MVSPDGTTFERKDSTAQGSTPGAGAGQAKGEAKSSPTDPTEAPPGENGSGKAGKNGAAPGGGSVGEEGAGAPTAPPSEVRKLFRPEKTGPDEKKATDAPPGGKGDGAAGRGSGGGQAAGDDPQAEGDPLERAAARRLQQVIQRIQTGRSSRPPAAGPSKAAPADPDRRRDW